MDARTALIETMLGACQDEGRVTKRLSTWEIDFIENVAMQFEAYGRLSDRQVEILERIYTEKTT